MSELDHYFTRCAFSGGDMFLKNLTSKIEMANMQQLFTSKFVISGKLCQIARPLPKSKMCGFKWRYALQLQMNEK